MNIESTSFYSVSNLSVLFHLRQAIQNHLLFLLSNYLDAPLTINQVNRHAIASGQFDWQDLDALRIQFFQQMKLFPDLSGIQWGNCIGDYVGVLDLGNRTPTVEIKQSRRDVNKHAFALDENGNPTDTRLGIAYEYDPRVRPWYRCSSGRDRPSWSKVYQYSSNVSVQLGVMSTLPVFIAGEEVGVLGCDIALTHVSQLLIQFNAQLAGTYFILEPEGTLIGSSVHPYPFDIKEGRAVRLWGQTCGDPIIAAVCDHVLQRCGGLSHTQNHQQFQCCIEDEVYFVDVVPFSSEGGLRWLVVSCLAADAVLPTVAENHPGTVIHSLASLQQTNENLLEQVRHHAIALQDSRQALKLSEERWLLALQGTNDGLWDWNLETNEVFFSERWEQISGFRPGELAHHFEEWKQRVHPEDWPRVEQAMNAHFLQETDYYTIEHRTRCKNGTYKWVLDRGRALWDDEGRPVRMVGSRSDITERKLMESRLIFQAEHDPLTKLLNRSALMQQIQARIDSPLDGFMLLMADIDRFKSVNDTLGHGVGDELIVRFAQALKTVFRMEDVVARLSGDEFVVLIAEEFDASAISRLFERIKTALRKIADELHLCTPVSVSLGVTSSRLSTGDPQDFLRDADIAMYAAKRGGGNRYVEFSPTLREQSITHLMMESALKRAVENHEFELFYQPILCLKSMTPVGLEALVRWHRPGVGLVPPGEFIAIAEKTGLILEIGHWILESACQSLHHWQSNCPELSVLSVNINVSMQQFFQIDFVEMIEHLLDIYAIDVNRLKLEITESCFMDNPDVAMTTIRGLKKRRISLCIDDFGTGYSSLSYLHKLPVESLKIDPSFIRRVDDDDQGIAMIRAILAMSQSLGIKVVAEGIETLEQLQKLQDLGCEFGQGYLFSEPCDAKGIETWIAARKTGGISEADS